MAQSSICAPSETRLWLPIDPPSAPLTAAQPRPEGRSGPIVAGRYRLDRVLGRGGMASVWLAADEMLLRPVAMKEYTLPEEVLDGATAGAWVLNEAQAAAQVSHPGVVRIYDLAVEAGQLWIVMEPLSGQTLADAIREQGRLHPARVVDIGMQLLEALQAVHGEGIVHRDVKPGNVHLCGDGRVVLTDFGLASRDGKVPQITPGQVVGSPPYMAPESIRDGSCGPASDLFSLGATLYAAVEGRKPFDEMSMFKTLEAVQHEAPPPARHAGRLRPVIDGLLTKDPDARLTLAEAHDYLKAVQARG
ncbi:MAG: eukaryotic-like serine/threonine-protein kinase [Pseudonocardiales bacterium]|jgi:serine/threonine protein kinase|nr:eukaryotic-like serine/threonine-protein kinase [Pseudonocardiales bacterium]